MKRIYFFLTLLFFFHTAQSQLLRWNTFGNTGLETTEPSVFNSPNITSSNLTMGAGITPAANTNRFGGSNWFDAGNTNPSTLPEAIAGNNYIEFIVAPNPGVTFTATSLSFWWGSSGSGPGSLALRSSIDGFASNIGIVTGIATGTFTYFTNITGLTNINTATTFRLYGYEATATGGTGGFDVVSNVVTVQLNGYTTGGVQPDNFRSKATGNWNALSSWESSADGINWVPASVIPDALTASTITIRNGDNITLPVSGYSIDQLVIEPGSQFTVAAGVTFTLEDGPGTDMDCQGTFLNAGGSHTITGTIDLPANATYIHNTNNSPIGVYSKATINAFSTWIYRGSSSLAVSTLTSGRTYGHLRFESSSGTVFISPILLSNATCQVNDLYVGPGVAFDYSGFQTNSSWIIGGNLNVFGTINSSSGQFNVVFTGAGKTIGGSVTIPFETIRINAAAAYTLATNIQLRTASRDLTILPDGVLDAATYQVSGLGRINLQGKLVTAHPSGLSSTLLNSGTKTIGLNSTVEYNSAGPQLFTSPFPGATYGNVIISGGGTKSLSGDATIASQLFLVNGLFQLNDNNLLLNSTTLPTIPQYSTASYIVTNGIGTLQQNIQDAGNYVFPVGTATALEEASVNFTVSVPFNRLSARFISGSPGDNGLPLAESGDNITHASVAGYWRISSSSPVTDLYTATFRARAFADIIDYTKLHLIKRANPASNWVLDGTHVTTTGSNALAILQRTGMSGFSDFAVGGQPAVSLPVTITSFSGYKDGANNLLKWTTASEADNRGFEVQRSLDGINYTAIGFVNSLALGGNSSAQLSYTFTDNSPSGDKQYYRLRQEDLNGKSKLSNVVLIRGNKPTGIVIDHLFPNPAKNTVNVIVAAEKKQSVTLFITDMAGKNSSQRTVTVETGSNTIPFDITQLSSGTYLVRLVCSEGCATGLSKFVKQ